VCQLTAVLELAPSTVSAHLADLRRVGLITERKEGRWVHYELAEAAEAGRCLELLWTQLEGDERVSNDNTIVKKLRKIPVDELCSMNTQAVKRAVSADAARRT